MSFLFPAMLGGLAAVSVPVAIHLLNKFRVKTTDWGAMRFLRDSLRKNERRTQLEDLLLLILRCALVACLVLAFARPVRRGFAASGTDSGPGTTLVLLDSSASMSQSNGVTTRFEDGKAAIRQWLDGRATGSQVGLFLVSDRTDTLIPTPQPDLGRVRKTLELARPGSRGTDLVQGIRLAYQTLRSVGGGPREIRVYTDGQASAWTKLPDLEKLRQENPEVRLVPVILGQHGEDNLAVTALRAQGGVPAVGQPFRVQVEVGNYGARPADGVQVSLSVDGAPATSQKTLAAIAPGGTQAEGFVVSFPSPGPHVVTAKIPPDALPVDNERSLAVEVVRRLDVLLVEGGPAAAPADRDAFFLANALLPMGREQARHSYLELHYTLLDSLRAADLDGCATVFLCNPGSITAATAQSLARYVEAGGNLVVFPGPRTDPAQWNQTPAWAALLPAPVSPAQAAPDPAHPPAWQNADYEHPVTALWNDPAQGNLGGVRTARYLPLKLKPATTEGSATALVRYADGSPAAAEWTRGQGRVVLFGSTATPEWNNLPLHPAFVPLVQRLLGFLNRRNEARLALAPGEVFVQEVPVDWASKSFEVRRPGGGSPQPAGQIVADGKRAFLRYAGTDEPGPYWMFVDGQPAAACAIQLDPAESDLRQRERAPVEALARAPAADTPAAPAAVQTVVTREFWPQLVWLAALLAVAESVLAHRFSLSR